MNAQEAIEIVNEKLAMTIKNEAGFIKRYEEMFGELSSQEKRNDFYEALSIVLESAKLLHKHSVPEMFEYAQKNLGNEEVKTVKDIYGIPTNILGINVMDFVVEDDDQ